VVRTGSLVFEQRAIYRHSADLAELLDLLSDLADAVESQPGRIPDN
jgi:uncharacterized protein YfcZ (UPF0381/DUF406 family)